MYHMCRFVVRMHILSVSVPMTMRGEGKEGLLSQVRAYSRVNSIPRSLSAGNLIVKHPQQRRDESVSRSAGTRDVWILKLASGPLS